MSKQKRIRQKRQAYWKKVIQRWQKSGLSVREYCRRHKIPETSFYQGRRRLAASSCKLCKIDPFAYLQDVLDRISTHPASQITDLLPANRNPVNK